MNAYIFQAALLCEDCGLKLCDHLDDDGKAPLDKDDESSYDSDAYPKGPYPDGGGEADSPQHCDHCRVFLDNPLTGDGETYVRDAFREFVETGRGNVDVLAEWKGAYSWIWDDFEDITLPIMIEESGEFLSTCEERWKRLAGS